MAFGVLKKKVFGFWFGFLCVFLVLFVMCLVCFLLFQKESHKDPFGYSCASICCRERVGVSFRWQTTQQSDSFGGHADGAREVFLENRALSALGDVAVLFLWSVGGLASREDRKTKKRTEGEKWTCFFHEKMKVLAIFCVF